MVQAENSPRLCPQKFVSARSGFVGSMGRSEEAHSSILYAQLGALAAELMRYPVIRAYGRYSTSSA